MDNSEQLLRAQQDVLTEMGRNLYNLQSIERLLKKIIACSSIEVRKNIDGEFNVKSIKTTRMMLGKLAEKFISDIVVVATDSQSDSIDGIETNSTELSIKINFNTELIDLEDYDKLKTTIEKLVYERNTLVHQFHELHSLGSIEPCQTALAYLKNQNIFIREQYEYFKSIASELDRLIKVQADIILSDEFLENITSTPDKLNPENLH